MTMLIIINNRVFNFFFYYDSKNIVFTICIRIIKKVNLNIYRLINVNAWMSENESKVTNSKLQTNI